MFRIQPPLQVSLPYHVLVSDRLPTQCSPVAVCAVAASSPYYLLDPSGLKRNLEPGLVDANDDLLLQLQGLPFPGMVEL